MWNIIPVASIKETIWEKLDDKKVKLDIDFIENNFKSAQAVVAKKDEKGDGKKEENKKVSLLSPNDSQNLGIVLSKLRLDNQVKFPPKPQIIFNALISCDEKVLTLSNLQSLLVIAPQEANTDLIKSYDGDKNLLAPPERFLYDMLEVKGYIYRVKSLIFTHPSTCQENQEELTKKVDGILSGLTYVQKDEKLVDFTQMCLAIGNYLNGTSARGGAWGFKLDSFDKLYEMKTNDAKKNLFIYIIEEQRKLGKEFLVETEEQIADIDLVSKIPVSQLKADLAEFTKGRVFWVM